MVNTLGVSYCDLAAKANRTADLVDLPALALNFIMHCFASIAACKALTSKSTRACFMRAYYDSYDAYLSLDAIFISVYYSKISYSSDITIRSLNTYNAKSMLNIEFTAYDTRNKAIKFVGNMENLVAKDKMCSNFKDLVIIEGERLIIFEDEEKCAKYPR